jgi:archaellum component FlaC
MPKVNHVKAARKDYPAHGIKKGDEYWWWQGAYKPKQFSKTPPKPSQVVGSEYLKTIYGMQEGLSESEWKEEGDVESNVEDYKMQLEELKSECEEKLENMPEHLRDSSDAGNTLQERIDSLDSAISDLESIELEVPEEDALKESYGGEIQGWIDEKKDEVEQALSNLS